MSTKIHSFTSAEPLLKVNAFIIEAAKELVIVDTTLTMTDSEALYQKAKDLSKPVAGIILTHGHPDHVAGTINIASQDNTPVFALASVKKLMEDTEAAKHAQWSGLFGAEWIPKWMYPTEIVTADTSIKIGSLRFTVLDIGSGGDCNANSVWLLEDDIKAAFVGDLLYNDNHTYMNDGSILRWIANLDNLSPVLKKFDNYYVGHGPQCDFTAIARQKDYFMRYCSNVLKETNGTGVFDDETRKKFEQSMLTAYPDYGCAFMVALSADRVGREVQSADKPSDE